MKINQESNVKQAKKKVVSLQLRQPKTIYFECELYYASSLERPAFKYSLFNLAMFATEIPFGHSASQA